MDGLVLTKLEKIEKELKEVKSLLKKESKKSTSKKSTLAGIWKGLEITDEELAEAKKAVFDFDIEKYVK